MALALVIVHTRKMSIKKTNTKKKLNLISETPEKTKSAGNANTVSIGATPPKKRIMFPPVSPTLAQTGKEIGKFLWISTPAKLSVRRGVLRIGD